VIGDRRLIRDLNTVRYSFNPYNINSMTMSLAMGTMLDGNYTLANCLTIEKNREYTVKALRELGFEMTDSKANFLFARHKEIEGGSLYRALKEKGVLVRHFDKERISDYNRITIGTKEQMDCLLQAIREILAETER
jgi:histidinol-phosphate aminotransferase